MKRDTISKLSIIMIKNRIIKLTHLKNVSEFQSEDSTSRDRPKSAPYPRLKNSKKTSKCQVFFYSSRKSKIFRNFFLKNLHTKKMDRVALTSHNAEKLKGGTLRGFSTSTLSQIMKKLKKFFFIFGKKSHNAEKNLKEEPFEIFQHPFCRKTSKKCRGAL